MLDENRIEDLTLFYQLLSRVHHGLKELCTSFAAYIKVCSNSASSSSSRIIIIIISSSSSCCCCCCCCCCMATSVHVRTLKHPFSYLYLCFLCLYLRWLFIFNGSLCITHHYLAPEMILC